MYEKTKGEIKCNPIKKVVYNGIIHGIRTSSNLPSNQTIDSYDKNDDELTVEYSNDYMEADVETTTSNKSDKELEIVKHVQLETQYYSVFRTVVRILLNRDDNFELKANIKEIGNTEESYEMKIKKLAELLESLTEDHVDFTDVDLKKIEEVHSCFRKCKSKDL